MSNNVNMAFYAPGSEVAVTQEDIEVRKRRILRAEQLGINITGIDEGEYENPDIVEALTYIMQDRDVPEELKQRILKENKFGRV